MNAPNKIDLNPEMAGERLLRLQDAIINDFTTHALLEIDSAAKVSREGLIDSMPEFLENPRSTLSQGETTINKQVSTSIGLAHGKVRAHQRTFTKEEIFVEYWILMRVIFRNLRQGAQLTEEVEDKITDSVVRGLGNALSSYMEFKDFFHKDFRNLERLKLLKALEHSNQELEKFFADADCPMFITVGRKHRCILANEAFEKLVSKKLEGELICNLFEPSSPFIEGLDHTFQTKNSFVHQDLSLLGGDHFHVYLHPYLDMHGDVKGIMGLLQSVKSKKIFLEVRHPQAQEIIK